MTFLLVWEQEIWRVLGTRVGFCKSKTKESKLQKSPQLCVRANAWTRVCGCVGGGGLELVTLPCLPFRLSSLLQQVLTGRTPSPWWLSPLQICPPLSFVLSFFVFMLVAGLLRKELDPHSTHTHLRRLSLKPLPTHHKEPWAIFIDV